MLYVTGDIHGDQRKWFGHIAPVLQNGDTLIVAGDFGIGFWDGMPFSQELFFDEIEKHGYTVLFADGNHEDFTKLDSYPVETMYGGRVHRIRRNLIHLMRGEIYTIENRTFFVFGGGYSLDRYRRKENESWWPREMPSEEEYRNAEENLKKAGYKADYVITHTAPSETVEYLRRTGRIAYRDGEENELRLTSFLDYVRGKVSYRHWYFGHFHTDGELWRNQTALYNEIVTPEE